MKKIFSAMTLSFMLFASVQSAMAACYNRYYPVASSQYYRYGAGEWNPGWLFAQVSYYDNDVPAGSSMLRMVIVKNGYQRVISGGFWAENLAPGSGTVTVGVANVDSCGNILTYIRVASFVP